MSKLSICPSSHIIAILLRRWITFKRSWKFILKSFIGTLIFSLLGVGLYWILLSWADPQFNLISDLFNNQEKADFFIVGKENDLFIKNITNQFSNILSKNRSIIPNYVYFDTLNELQEYIYQHQVNPNDSNITDKPMGLDFSLGQSKVCILHNSTIIDGSDAVELSSFLLFAKSLWDIEFNSTFSELNFEYFTIHTYLIKSIYCSSGTFLLVSGLLTSSLYIASQPISDIRGEVRQYMMQCTLKILPYWLGNFICDFILWIILTTFVWCFFLIGKVQPFFDNAFNCWYLLVFQGPSMILFLYCFSFMFSVPSSAPRQIFILSILMIFVSTIACMVVGFPNPIGLDIFLSLFPPTSLQQVLCYVVNYIGYEAHNLKFYWTTRHTMCYLIMQWIDIVIYSIILTIIEANRIRIQRKLTQNSFSNFVSSFKFLKNQNKQFEEAKKMEDEVHNSSDWAIRIENVSRLFIDDDEKPIVAVNGISLGVKEFSIFGILGANGAGKTTLIKMITGSLPPSSGTIEIFNTKVEDIENSMIVSLCPQSNSHLFKKLTPKEHFKIYSLLFQLDQNEVEDIVDDLISGMELNDLEDVPVCELSLGDARKLGIALSFFGPSKILILDEPTASLDPVACRCVQQMILEYKGEKTFILCTHLLSEAEFLCDMISIMLNGNIYTVGTPQYLSEKFGNEYRIEIELNNSKKSCLEKVKSFFNSNLPEAKLTLKKSKSHIYLIPASSISLAQLFKVMQDGKMSDNGFDYFTCSSTSLEKVFLQIVHSSELAGTNRCLNDEFEENYYTQDDDLHSRYSSFYENTSYNKIDDDDSINNNEYEIP